MSDFILMADLAVNLPNDLPGGATPQGATMDDVFGTTLADSRVFTDGLRPTSVRYPNGRRIHLDYGPGGGMADALGRVAAIRDDDGGSPGDTLAEYAYLGIGRIVQEGFPEP